jgi:hypothetical protein
MQEKQIYKFVNLNRRSDAISVAMSGKKQTTLFDHKFTKKVAHRGHLVNVVPASSSANILWFSCGKCPRKFKSRGALWMHKQWCSKQGNGGVHKKLPVVVNLEELEEEVVAKVIEEVVRKVVKLDEMVESGESTNGGRHGANERRSYTFEFKLEVVNCLNSGDITAVDVAHRYGVNKTLVSKWKKDEVKIVSLVAKGRLEKLLKKSRTKSKHRGIFKKLNNRFESVRKRGKKVSWQWFYSHGNKIAREENPDAPRLPRSSITYFIKQYKIKLRRVQRKNRVNNEKFAPKLQHWHSTLREGLIKTGRTKAHYDSKWGRFRPSRRYNVDQVPMPFAIDRKTTYEVNVPKEERRAHRVWVSNPGSGLDKRQCSLQVCFSPEDNTVKVGIIFRGTGTRIKADEKAAYHPSIDVYWQKNAWADRAVSVEWVQRTLAAAVGEEEFVLFCDNLLAQTSDEFLSAVRGINGIVWFRLKDATGMWQPVDSGMGALYKRLVGQIQDEWLEEEENIELWLGNSERRLTASDRRILITQWVGKAHDRLLSADYDRTRYRCFEKTGCLITADGSADENINPEGLLGYVVPQSLPIQAAEDHADPQIPEPGTDTRRRPDRGRDG